MVPTMEISAKDAMITWYRAEFAAANAIIDALCSHIKQLSYGGEYDAVFASIHSRRMNWIPVLQMQKYFSIADVALELRKVAAKKKEKVCGEKVEEGAVSESVDDDSPDSDVTDTGSQEVQINLEQLELCDNHKECGFRHELIKLTKGFTAKEPIRGHMVNVVKGLKMYDDIFTDGEMLKLNAFVDELRVAGQNGELAGETYVLFNKEVKGSKREQVQLGLPIFGHTQKTANIEPIPPLLQSIIDHLAQWHIIPESRKPNGCIINYFDEGEYSQPFMKPPHLDQPIFSLQLSESTLAFGQRLVNDGQGNFKGNLMLHTKPGSVVVMRFKSADVARHVMCTSPSKRVSITFYRVYTNTATNQAMPRVVIPVMVSPFMMSHRKVPRGGTGVFLPWGPGKKRPTRQLPPRARKARMHALETMSDPGYES